jgi:hypothetical protein
MAVLLLTKLWINLLSTGEAVSAHTQPQRPSVFSLTGEVLSFAGGRQRSVTAEGESGTFSFTLQDVTLAQRDTLRTWFGLNVIVRDHRGQMFTGVFYAANVAERITEPTLYEISITLQTTTTAEGV